MARYRNLTELAEAFESGELDRAEWELLFRRNNSSLRWNGQPEPGLSDEEIERTFDRKYLEGRDLYTGGGYVDLLIDALSALDIPGGEE